MKHFGKIAMLLGVLAGCSDASTARTSSSDKRDGPPLAYDSTVADSWFGGVDTFTSEMGDAPKVTPRMHTYGERDLFGADSAAKTLLEIKCADGVRLDVIVYPSTYVDGDSRTVRFRVDNQPPVEAPAMHLNVGGDGLVLLNDPVELIDAITGAGHLRVEIKEPTGAQVVTRFNVRGLSNHLESFRTACAETGVTF